MRDNLHMPEPQVRYQHFTPWRAADDRSCWTCAHAIGYDGVHLWCERHRVVVAFPCPCWERGARRDERDR